MPYVTYQKLMTYMLPDIASTPGGTLMRFSVPVHWLERITTENNWHLEAYGAYSFGFLRRLRMRRTKME